MSDFEQLKPCPFCGGVASEGSVGSSVPGSEDDGYLYIECSNCNGAFGKPFIGVHGDEKEVLRGIWNARAAKQSMQGEIIGYASKESIKKARNGGDAIFGREIPEVTRTVPLYTHAPDSAARIAEQDARINELEERIGEHDICSKLIDAWCAEHGGKITWGKAIDITAIITKMDADERSRLLTLDEPDIQNELVALRGSVKELEQQLDVARKVPDGYALVPIEPTGQIIKAMAESKATDDEGQFPALCDLIDFSGENKTRSVLKAAYAAMVYAAIRQIGGAE